MKKIQSRNNLIWALTIVIIIVFILNAIMLYESRKVYQTKELNMFVKVSNYTGFKVDSDALYFGTLPNSGKSTRLLRITNGDVDSRVMLIPKGDVVNWIVLPDNPIFLERGETVEINISLIVPEGVLEGDYSGKLKLNFLKA